MKNSKEYNAAYYADHKEVISQKRKQNYQQKKASMKKIKNEKMLTRKAKDAKVELMMDTRYKQQDGSYAVVVRVYYQRKYKYIPTKYSMTPDEWNDIGDNVMQDLRNTFDRVHSLVLQRCTEGTFNLMTLNNIDADNATVTTLCELMIEKGGINTSHSTMVNYRNAANIVKEAFGKDLPLDCVCVDTVQQYKQYMVGNGYSSSTVNIYLSCVKAAVNYGIYKGYLKPQQYPFKRNAYEIDKVSIPQSAKRNDRYLSLTDIRTIWDEFTATKNRYVGYFLFSYLCGGMNLADILNLRFDDFYFEEGGIKFRRVKTRNKVDFETVVPVTSWVIKIFDTLGIEPKRGEYIFAEMQNEGKSDFANKQHVANVLNYNIAKTCYKLGIKKNVTITFARHSFATIATKLRMPANLVEFAMAHSNGGVSSHYIGAWNVGEMKDEFERLIPAV